MGAVMMELFREIDWNESGESEKINLGAVVNGLQSSSENTCRRLDG